MVYSIVLVVKIIFLAMFYSSPFAIYFIWAVEISYFIGFAILRPYKKTR